MHFDKNCGENCKQGDRHRYHFKYKMANGAVLSAGQQKAKKEWIVPKIFHNKVTTEAFERIWQVTGSFHNKCIDSCEYAKGTLPLIIEDP